MTAARAKAHTLFIVKPGVKNAVIPKTTAALLISSQLPSVVIFWSFCDLKLKTKFYFWLENIYHVGKENAIKLLFTSFFKIFKIV